MYELALTRGKIALVDDEDYAAVVQYRWIARPNKTGTACYAMTHIDGRTVYMHRLILGAAKGQEIDHANANGLDNRRANLRICTRSQNNANIRKTTARSGFRGVGIHPDMARTKRYRGAIQLNGKRISGPWRKSALEAALDRDTLALVHHGQFAVLNFQQMVLI